MVGGAVQCVPIKEDWLHVSFSLTKTFSLTKAVGAEMKLIFSVVAVLVLCGTLTHGAAVNDNDVTGNMTHQWTL